MFSYYRWCWYNSHRVDECSNAFFVALYSQQTGTSVESARYNIFRKKKRNRKAMAFPQNICESIAAIHTWAHLKDKSCCGKQRQ